jgi:hypothetical protein
MVIYLSNRNKILKFMENKELVYSVEVIVTTTIGLTLVTLN